MHVKHCYIYSIHVCHVRTKMNQRGNLFVSELCSPCSWSLHMCWYLVFYRHGASSFHTLHKLTNHTVYGTYNKYHTIVMTLLANIEHSSRLACSYNFYEALVYHVTYVIAYLICLYMYIHALYTCVYYQLTVSCYIMGIASKWLMLTA